MTKEVQSRLLQNCRMRERVNDPVSMNELEGNINDSAITARLVNEASL